MVFNRLTAFWSAFFPWLCLCAIWDWTITALSYFLFFGGDFFGAACLARLPCWEGIISSALHRDNDIARPRMGKIMIYHVQNSSGPSSEQNCAMWLDLTLAPHWRVCVAQCMPKSNPIRNKYNPLDSSVSGRFPKEAFGNIQNSDTLLSRKVENWHWLDCNHIDLIKKAHCARKNQAYLAALRPEFL